MQQKKTTKEEYQKCVNVVVEYINQHLGEDIDLKSLARISNFSPFYFHRIMKAFLGEPIGTFIVRTRTEAAARLLRYSDIPIADIAYRIGYSSPSSLSKVFRQFYGISPLEYRNNKNFVIMKPAIIRPDLELKSEIKSIPARNVIYIRLSGDYKLNDYGGTWGRLWQFIKEQKLPMGDFSPLCIYHDDPKVTPHGRPTDKTFQEHEFITIDFGITYKGYQSDMTRTICIGEPDPKLKEIYDVVLKAQCAGVDFIRSGVSGKEVDSYVRGIIEEHGYGEYFTHGLGHGMGMGDGELPLLNQNSDTILEDGMIMSCEPGIYVPGLGGVRIEDDVVIINGKGVPLNKTTKELIIVEGK